MASKLELEKENKALRKEIEMHELELSKGKTYDLEKGETVRFKKGKEEYRAKLNNNGNVSVSPVFQQNNLEDFNSLNPLYDLGSDELVSGVNEAIEIAIGDSEE
jgi:hypothetical protein